MLESEGNHLDHMLGELKHEDEKEKKEGIFLNFRKHFASISIFHHTCVLLQ